MRDKEGAQWPEDFLSSSSFGGEQVAQWEIFDAYVEELERQKLSKERTGQQQVRLLPASPFLLSLEVSVSCTSFSLFLLLLFPPVPSSSFLSL